MDNLRKANMFFGKTITSINTEENSSEVDSFMESTLGEIKSLFMELPKVLENLTFGDLIDISLMDDDKIEEIFMEKCFPNGDPSEEEIEEAARGMIRFSSLLGVDISEDDP